MGRVCFEAKWGGRVKKQSFCCPGFAFIPVILLSYVKQRTKKHCSKTDPREHLETYKVQGSLCFKTIILISVQSWGCFGESMWQGNEHHYSASKSDEFPFHGWHKAFLLGLLFYPRLYSITFLIPLAPIFLISKTALFCLWGNRGVILLSYPLTKKVGPQTCSMGLPSSFYLSKMYTTV